MSTNRAAIVTGGAQGIGRATAHRLAAQSVAICLVDREEAQLEATAGELEAKGAHVEKVVADVTVKSDVENMASTCLSAFGRILTSKASTKGFMLSELSSKVPNNLNKDLDRGVLLEAKPKVKKPPLYRVILHNDDYTPMEFVVYVLQVFFGFDGDKAQQIMLATRKA